MRLLFFASCLLISSWSIGQPGYKLQFKINGLKDTVVYLGHFYGEATYIKDTAQVNGVGNLLLRERPLCDKAFIFWSWVRTSSSILSWT
jgi:hypothetical protein